MKKRGEKVAAETFLLSENSSVRNFSDEITAASNSSTSQNVSASEQRGKAGENADLPQLHDSAILMHYGMGHRGTRKSGRRISKYSAQRRAHRARALCKEKWLERMERRQEKRTHRF